MHNGGNEWDQDFGKLLSPYFFLHILYYDQDMKKYMNGKKNLFCYLFKNNLRGVFPVCNGIRDRAECKANENSAPMEDTFLWHL